MKLQQPSQQQASVASSVVSRWLSPSSSDYFFSLRSALPLIAFLLSLILWGWIVYDLKQTRDMAIGSSTQTNKALSLLLENTLRLRVQKLDVVLSEFVWQYQKDIAAHTLGKEHIKERLGRNLLLLPEVIGVRMVDALGNHVMDSSGEPYPVNVADRPYFIQLRDDPNAGLVISSPLRSRMDNAWVIVFGRRLETANGQFAGAVFAMIPCSFFEERLKSMDLSLPQHVYIFGQNLEEIAHWPLADRKNTGKRANAHPFPEMLEDPQMEGRMEAPLDDGVSKFFYFRNLHKFGIPVLIAAAHDKSIVLHEWHQRLTLYILLGSLVTGIFLFLLWERRQRYRRLELLTRWLEREITEKNHEWRALLDSIPDPAWLLDKDNHILAANEAFLTRTQLPRSKVVGHMLSMIFSPEDYQVLLQGQAEVYEKSTQCMQIVWLGMDSLNGNKKSPYEIRRVPVFDNNGLVCGIAGVAREISERYEAESRQQLITQIFDHDTEGLIILNNMQEITVVNRSLTEITGYEQNELLGQHLNDFILNTTEASSINHYIALLNTQDIWNGEILFRCKDNTGKSMNCRIVSMFNEHHKAYNWIVFLNDISERKSTETHINILINTDMLTGLLNRNGFVKSLEERLVAGVSNAVLLLELNQLALVNNAYGHMAGDHLLRRIGKRLRQLLRGQDIIGRLGDERFCILLTNTDHQGIEIVVRKLIPLVAKPIALDNESITCTVCIGICITPDDGHEAEEVMKNVDSALHYAKSVGSNSFRFFSKEMNANLLTRLRHETDLRSALDRKEFLLYYQPQVEISSQRIVGCEALLRWNHPKRGLVPPGEFIPVAEESGLILPLGQWVMEEACRQNKAWQDQGLPPIVMAVNISALQFSDTQFINHVSDILKESGLDPRYLELEITESALMQEPERVVEMLMQLKNIGLRLSIDDFGTGYSSLTYLKRFPIDKIKIDQSFIRDLQENNDDAAIVRMVLNMAHELDMQSIAEGVEQEHQLGILSVWKCHEYQGYLCSKPVPSHEFEDLLRRHPNGFSIPKPPT